MNIFRACRLRRLTFEYFQLADACFCAAGAYFDLHLGYYRFHLHFYCLQMTFWRLIYGIGLKHCSKLILRFEKIIARRFRSTDGGMKRWGFRSYFTIKV